MATQPAAFPFSRKHLNALTDERLEELRERSKLAKLPFPEAAMRWLETRRTHLAPRTLVDYEWHIGILCHFFGKRCLARLADPDLIRAYQQERSKTCGPSIVNRECSLIQQMLKHICKWNEVAPFYEPIPMPRESPGRAMTPEEERKLFEIGALNPNWAVAYWATLLAANTAAGPAEICGLRLGDVFTEDLTTARIHIHEQVKNEHRVREVPLNNEALVSARALRELARSHGAVEPEHFLIPYRTKRNAYDPGRHGFWPRTTFREMCAAAGIRIRPYDLRHYALTRLAEKQPEQLVLKIAGHVSPKMLRRIYAHVRLPALRAAVQSISAVGKPPKVTAKQASPEPEQVFCDVATIGEKLGIPAEKAMQLLIEYERSRGGAKGDR